ncbi:MAG TPA: glycoside hydrolase family 20 zincin-like fold domain-containing protein [Phycisphaerae bacterium]|jgi:hypothetical protein
MNLLPSPKSLVFQPGSFLLPDDLYLVLEPHPRYSHNLFAAERFMIAAEALLHTRIHLVAGPSTNPRAEIRVRLDEDAGPAKISPEIGAQSYRLAIGKEGIEIVSPGAAGIFYALQTLLQVIRESAFDQGLKKRKLAALPHLRIADHPDFERRGFYHDTARGKVPTVHTLLQLIDDLGHLKYNEFQLYIENNFQFRQFPEMYDDTSPLTAEEIVRLDVACRARHIDFVPSLTSLGHFEKILLRARFRKLAEAEPAELKAIGAPCWFEEGPWSLCVTDAGAKKLLRGMYAEFAPNFSSGQFNICCDEAYDLGRVRSKKLAEKIGTGQMYVDWIKFCDRLVKSHGKKKSIQMWGDIILNHPVLISQLPADATLLEWGYEHDHKFDEHCKTFAARLTGKRSYYVAPGTSSWLTLSSRTKNSFGNMHRAATAGLRHGARGFLLTDWGDQGHQQMLGVSLAPAAYGAAVSWNLASTPNPMGARHSKVESFLEGVSLHLFQDRSMTIASLAYDLGLTYERLGWQRFNASLDHFLFREKWDFANYVNRAPREALKKTIAATRKISKGLYKTAMRRPDASLLAWELVFTCQIIAHTCERTLLRQQWLAADPARRNPEEPTLRNKPPKPLPKNFAEKMKTMGERARILGRQYKQLWLARNKSSRLADIQKEFQRLIVEYKKFQRP